MEKSKLPVFRAHTSSIADLTLPSAKKPCPLKPMVPLCIKDPNIGSFSAAPNPVVFKAGDNGKKPVLSKKMGPPARGPINRHRMESELRDKNQLLEAANTMLQYKLMAAEHQSGTPHSCPKGRPGQALLVFSNTSTSIDSWNSSPHLLKNTIQEMSGQQETLKEELKELQRRLDKIILIFPESRNIDSVSGKRIIAAAEKSSKVKKETKALAENLLTELKTFTLATKEQKELIQTVKAKWEEAEDSRNLFLQEQEAFQSDLERFQLSLERTEKWLDL